MSQMFGHFSLKATCQTQVPIDCLAEDGQGDKPTL